jgi:hypothetical protein
MFLNHTSLLLVLYIKILFWTTELLISSPVILTLDHLYLTCGVFRIFLISHRMILTSRKLFRYSRNIDLCRLYCTQKSCRFWSRHLSNMPPVSYPVAHQVLACWNVQFFSRITKCVQYTEETNIFNDLFCTKIQAVKNHKLQAYRTRVSPLTPLRVSPPIFLVSCWTNLSK